MLYYTVLSLPGMSSCLHLEKYPSIKIIHLPLPHDDETTLKGFYSHYMLLPHGSILCVIMFVNKV